LICGGGVFVPNIKSAKKRVLVSKVENDRNKANKSLLKTNVKKFEAAAATGDKEAAAAAAKVAVATIDKSVGKGILHKNNAAHKKSSIAQKLNSL
jgi:small subunit ribosomal protein S20